jgi:hypothetical protein
LLAVCVGAGPLFRRVSGGRGSECGIWWLSWRGGRDSVMRRQALGEAPRPPHAHGSQMSGQGLTRERGGPGGTQLPVAARGQQGPMQQKESHCPRSPPQQRRTQAPWGPSCSILDLLPQSGAGKGGRASGSMAFWLTGPETGKDQVLKIERILRLPMTKSRPLGRG